MENIFISDFVDIKVETLGGVVIVEWKQVCRGMELRDMLAKVVEIAGRTPNAKVMFVYVHYFSDLIPDERTNFFTKLKEAGVTKFAYSIANCDAGLANQLMSQYRGFQIIVSNNTNQAYSNLMANSMNAQQQMAAVPQANPNKNARPKKKNKGNWIFVLSLLCPLISSLILESVDSYVTKRELVHLISYFEGANIRHSVEPIANIISIIGLILLIIGRVRYPDNKFGKVLMWIYIIIIVIAVLFVLVFAAACGVTIESCGGLG